MDAAKEAKAAKAKSKALRPWFKKKRFWVLGIIGLIVIVSVSSQGGSTTTTNSGDTNQSDQGSPSDTNAESGSDFSNETASQENARESAENYLRFQSFSRSGLIDQLEFEKFSTADATYAVDAIDVDWNEQAAKKAESYLDTSSFSKQGLIDQLLFEGFSQSEAEYGVSTTGL